MQKLFNKILVPINFSAKSFDLLERAFVFARKYDCSMHLLHAITVSPFNAIAAAEGYIVHGYNTIDNQKEVEFQMEKLCRQVDFLSGDTMHVEYTIVNGTWNQGVIDFVNENNVDLVLVGQTGNLLQKGKMLLNPDTIAEKTNVPVITIPANRRLTKLYSIVIPITDFLPVRKLMYGVYMAMRWGTTIKLLGIANSKTEEKVHHYMAKADKLIGDNCDVRVEKEIVYSKNIAEAVNHFANHKSADLVIVNPGTQTKMKGFFSSLLGNIIQKYASPPVLTVNPA